jgi:uncharacterized protein YrrD
MNSTNLSLGAKVHDNQGNNVGNVKILVAEPNEGKITHFILEQGAIDVRQIVIDLNWIMSISNDGKVVALNLTKDQVDEMPNYIERDYTTTRDQGMLAGTEGVLYPVSGIVGATPLAGGFAPVPVVVDDAAYSERVNVPENSLLIKAGATVMARDGKLGKVKQVNFDSTSGKLVSFIVEKGFLFTEDVLVPASVIESGDENEVYVSAGKAEIMNLSQSGTYTTPPSVQ